MKGVLPVLLVLARLAGLAGLLLIVPLMIAISSGPGDSRELSAYAIPLGVSILLYLASRLFGRGISPQLRSPAQGFQCVVLGWLLFATIGALPYWISGVLPTFADAWFEAMSGFTTTGATVFQSVEAVPPALLLWRAMTQFIGGLGIIALFVAILPALGAGGVVLFRSEVTSSILEDRLRPRVVETARVLWRIYVVLTAAHLLALWLCDVPFFDAVCHSMTTVSTGGFSTRDLSLAAFSSEAQWVTIVFMFLGGTSFLLHGRALQSGIGSYVKSDEFRLYVGILLVAVLTLTVLLMSTAAPMIGTGEPSLDPATHDEGTFSVAVRDAAFQATAIMTSTGYAQTDYNRWPDAARFMMILLMFVGGCAGSTSGGAKVFRFLLVYRTIARQTKMILSPSRVITVRYDGAAVPGDVLLAVSSIVLLFVLIALGGSLFLMFLNVPFEEALSGTVACVLCIGPALGDVGPAGNYSAMPAAAKIFLSVLMLMGRLELYAVLVLIARSRRP